MKRILCFGDSNTWGLIPGTGKRFADGVRWTSIIRNDLEQSGYEIIEEGLCGRTTIFEDPDRIEQATSCSPCSLKATLRWIWSL